MRKPTLRECQEWIGWISTRSEGVFEALKTPVGEPPMRVLPFIQSDDRLDNRHRLAIYSNAYFLRLKSMLDDDFERSRALLGAEDFDRLAADFLKACPSTHPSAAMLSRSLPEFVASHSQWGQDQVLKDLLRLEWEILETIYRPYVANFDLSKLAKIQPDEWPAAVFECDPTLRVWATQSEVDLYWQNEITRREEIGVGRTLVIGARRLSDGQSATCRFDHLEAQLLAWIRQRKTLGEICELAAETESTRDAEEIVSLLGAWLSEGILKGIQLGKGSI